MGARRGEGGKSIRSPPPPSPPLENQVGGTVDYRGGGGLFATFFNLMRNFFATFFFMGGGGIFVACPPTKKNQRAPMALPPICLTKKEETSRATHLAWVHKDSHNLFCCQGTSDRVSSVEQTYVNNIGLNVVEYTWVTIPGTRVRLKLG